MQTKFSHDVEDLSSGFKHRVTAVETDSMGGRHEHHGRWTSYTGIARLELHGRSLMAVTEYFDGTFEPGRVYELTTPRHAERLNKTVDDAHWRVHDMSVGCLVDATDEFLVAMICKLELLKTRVNNELQERCKAGRDRSSERESDR